MDAASWQRAISCRALALLLLVAVVGIPWGLYNESFRQNPDAWKQWQDMDPSMSIGFAGTVVWTLFLLAGVITLYELLWHAIALVHRRLARKQAPSGAQSH